MLLKGKILGLIFERPNSGYIPLSLRLHQSQGEGRRASSCGDFQLRLHELPVACPPRHLQGQRSLSPPVHPRPHHGCLTACIQEWKEKEY